MNFEVKFVSLFLLKTFKRCGDRNLFIALYLDVVILAGVHLPSPIFPYLVHGAATFTHRKFSS